MYFGADTNVTWTLVGVRNSPSWRPSVENSVTYSVEDVNFFIEMGFVSYKSAIAHFVISENVLQEFS